MAKISAEALLLNALVNTGDVEAARRYGISAEHFDGYRTQFNWLQNHLKQYQTQPSRDIFVAAFPSFPTCDHDDVRSATDALLEGFWRRRMVAGIDTASKLINHDLRAAYEALTACEPVFTSPPPRSLVTDMGFLDSWNDPMSRTISVPGKTLQRCTGGIGPGQLWYWAARTNHGKSAHQCNVVANAICNDERVKFYSLEMTETELRARIHAILAHRYGYSGITALGILRKEVDYHAYKTFVSEIGEKVGGEFHVHTPADGFVTPGVIASSISEYDLVVVDHIGLVRPDGGGHSTDDWRVAARVSNALKEIALASSKPIISAAQVNRDGDRGSGPPDVKNLSGTDALGQDADVVITMRTMAKDVATVCALQKNRHGPKAKWWTKFDVNNGDFKEISFDEADALEIEADTNE